MSPEAARAEACKNSMFPGTAIMYWLGTEGMHALARERAAADGAAFSLRRLSRSSCSRSARSPFRSSRS